MPKTPIFNVFARANRLFARLVRAPACVRTRSNLPLPTVPGRLSAYPTETHTQHIETTRQRSKERRETRAPRKRHKCRTTSAAAIATQSAPKEWKGDGVGGASEEKQSGAAETTRGSFWRVGGTAQCEAGHGVACRCRCQSNSALSLRAAAAAAAERKRDAHAVWCVERGRAPRGSEGSSTAPQTSLPCLLARAVYKSFRERQATGNSDYQGRRHLVIEI